MRRRNATTIALRLAVLAVERCLPRSWFPIGSASSCFFVVPLTLYPMTVKAPFHVALALSIWAPPDEIRVTWQSVLKP